MLTLLHPCRADQNMPTPPVAETIDKELTIHGNTRVDPYYWINERDNPKVIEYLEQENAYTRAIADRWKALEDQLFEETKARVKQDDSSVPYDDRGFSYYSRTEDGQQYPIFCRTPIDSDVEEIM
ncbi:MAG: oligopeptidase B, partial [Planctomycetota bacterium]